MIKFLQKDGAGSILNFGELLLRICPDAEGIWLENDRLPYYLGGAELNVARALSLWNIPVKYITALPPNGLSENIVAYLQRKGIDTSSFIFNGKRTGLFYLTTGQDMKNSGVIYDREHSAFSELRTGQIDWDKAFNGVTWFHFSAICPAISQNVAEVCREALEAATRKGITISVDLNYRAKLWKYGKEPVQAMPGLLKYCHLVMGNVWAAEKMLGIAVTPDIHESGQQSIYLKEALNTSKEIIRQYPQCEAVANTFRFDMHNGIQYYTALYTGKELYHSATYEADNITDKVGSGDCYMAGLIYGFYKQYGPKETIDFATAAAFEKLFIAGDTTTKTVEDIEKAIIK